MIPKTITTIWLSEDTVVPKMFAHCIASQMAMQGYTHHTIDLDEARAIQAATGSLYLQQALDAKKWVKAVDWLRMYWLYKHGGWFLDADVEIMPHKNFDDLLDNKIVAAREVNGFIGVAVMGAVAGQLFINNWVSEVVERFRGDDDLNFESSMDVLVRGYYEKNWPKDGFTLVPTKIFYPYDHASGTVDVTPGTITYHHFLKTWVKPKNAS